jgi:GT2 family glycosyltransferase
MSIRDSAIPPRVSIILVNTNELHHLKPCLHSIFQQTYPNFEVLLVDNASTDGSLEYVREAYPSVKIIQNTTNLGYAGANNVGFKHANGELVAVLNPDTRVNPDWLIELVPLMQAQQIGLATPKILLFDQPNLINTCGNQVTFSGLTFCRGLAQARQCYPVPEIVSAVSGAAFVIQKSLLDQIGGFDERFFLYYEETDLSLRAALAGYSCLYVPAAIVYHQYTFKFSPQKAFYQERNRLFCLLKTFRWRTLLALLPSLLVAEIVAWGYACLHGPGHLVQKFCTYTWLIANRSQVLAARRTVQALRRVSDRAILEHFDCRLNFTWTTRPWLATLLDLTINPLMFLLGRFSRFIITW